jgi:uncharacterized BrkB/YihY/UPF0761 family membrane protein
MCLLKPNTLNSNITCRNQNFVESTVLFVERFARSFANQKHNCLLLISSCPLTLRVSREVAQIKLQLAKMFEAPDDAQRHFSKLKLDDRK